MLTVVERSTLSASGGIPSGPAAFPFFKIFKAFRISAFVGGLVLTLSGESAGGCLVSLMAGVDLGVL